MRRSPRRVALAASVLLACGPETPGETGADSTASGSTDPVTSSGAPTTSDATGVTSGSLGSTSAASTGSSSTATDASSDPSSGTTGGADTTGGVDTSTTAPDTGGEDCSPPDEPAVKAFWGVQFPGMPTPTDFEGTCTVTAETPTPGGALIALACAANGADVSVELEISRAPTQPLADVSPGASVELAYREDMPWWTNRWFSLRKQGGTPLLAGIRGDAIAPPGTTAQAFFGMSLALQKGLCAPSPSECGPLERAALAVDPFGLEPIPVLDGQYREIVNLPGAVLTWVEEMTVQSVVDCTDTPVVWAQVLLQSSFGP